MRLESFIAHFPLTLTLYRSKSTPLSGLKSVFKDAVIFYPVLYYLLRWDLCTYTWHFALLYIASWAFYEIGYLLNDYVAVKHEDAPSFREYTKHVNFKAALIIRIALLIFVAWLIPSLPYLIWLVVLGITIVLFNSRKKKRDRITFYPYMRLIKAMLVPIVMSNFNISILYPCLILYLPFLATDARSYTLSVTIRYHSIDRTLFDKPFYEAFLIFFPFQIITLWEYPLQIFMGELIYAFASVVVDRKWKKGS